MDANKLLVFCIEQKERFMNLLALQKATQYDTVGAEFTERELTGLVLALSELKKKLKEQEHEYID